MHKLLIANRGEIAVRIIHAAHELGLRTVAVYSEADRQAPHTYLADEAYLLGPPEPVHSYLDSARLLEIAQRSGADAVHPGYGFLAENAAFAEDCRRAGLTYVGPSAEAIRQMGSKILSKEIAEHAGVPVVPSYHAPDAATLAQQGPAAAARLGYPILVKASAGGGGKGMRIVEQPADLLPAMEAGAREAQQAFGDATLMLEKYIPHPRHIEVQILGDHFGHRVHLHERECSIQRRHQKIVEESPSPAVDATRRAAMGDAAVALGRAAGYIGAGTVEFIVDPAGDYYFLEVNTRLQVEHPVTELVTGCDLVREQINVAAGHELSFRQADVSLSGHAIECRVYAEDPENNFFPSPGRISFLRVPTGPGIRDDGGVTEGDDVSIFYDPMISKLAAWGRTRAEATDRLRRALDEYAIGGIKTTLAFFREVVRDQEFIEAKLDTGFITRFNERRAVVAQPDGASAEADIAIIAAALAYQHAAADVRRVEAPVGESRWRMSGRSSSLNNGFGDRSNRC